MSIYQTCPLCKLSTSINGSTCDLCIDEAKEKYISTLLDEIYKLREALQFTTHAAICLYRPYDPIDAGLSPVFYHSLTYEGDLELMKKTLDAVALLELSTATTRDGAI